MARRFAMTALQALQRGLEAAKEMRRIYEWESQCDSQNICHSSDAAHWRRVEEKYEEDIRILLKKKRRPAK
jgi:hypothetical protein